MRLKLHMPRYKDIEKKLEEIEKKQKGLNTKKKGSSGKWSDKVSIERKKTAEHFVYLNNHNQIYNNEQQFSISCMGALQP